jgi:peroxiredoxin
MARRLTLTLALVVLVLGLVRAGGAHAAPAAPPFHAKLLDSNTTLDSRDLLGKKVIVVRFQASWCKPCARESDALSRLATRYRERGVEVIAFHVQDTAADARRFMRTQTVAYHVALDPKLAVGNRFGASGTPYTVVIDKKGEIVARLSGVSAVSKLPRILDAALAERPSRKL